MNHWYVFQSKKGKEQFLCEQLHIREIETFYPSISSHLANSRPQKAKPYFPGYIFGWVDLDVANRSLLDWLPGAVRIVSFGGEPAWVPDHFINVLRQHLDTINHSVAELSRSYQPGDMVTIQGGPFAGYEGIFNAHLAGRDRVEVLLRMLQGAHLRVELSIDQITSQK